MTIKQWDVQTSYGQATATTDTVLDQVNAVARYSMSFTTQTVGANTLYVFTLPGNTTTGTATVSNLDASNAKGAYIPQRQSDNSLQYNEGPQVAFYLSDRTGSESVAGGTILWRATADVGGSLTPDTQWSMANTNVGRFSGLQSFTISSSNQPNTVTVSLSVLGSSGHNTKTYVTTRDMYMSSVIFGASIGASGIGKRTA